MTIRKFLLACAFFNLIVFNSHSQSLQGEWKIDHLIMDSSVQEYQLSPLSEDPRKNYGNRFKLDQNGSFHSWHSAWCGMDCFTTSIGKYTIIGEDYIQFRIDTVEYAKHCEGSIKDASFPIDAGLFYIYRNNEKVKLIRTTGSLAYDQLNAVYVDSVEVNYLESTKFSNLLSWIKLDAKVESTPENIADFYATSAGVSGLTVLSSKLMPRGMMVVLVEIDDEFNYLFCHSENSGEKEVITEVAVYDKQQVNRIYHSVADIDERLNSFKIETVKNQTEFGEEVNLIYRKFGKIKKVVIEKKYSNGLRVTNYYFENNVPTFMSLSSRLVDAKSEKQYFSDLEFFLNEEDENKFISKTIQSVYHGTERTEYSFCLNLLEEFLVVVK